MKIVGKIIQWIFVVIFVFLAIYTGVHIASFFFLIGAFLMLPIKPIRNLLKKIKIKSWLAILLSVVTVFTGVSLTPIDTHNPYDYIPDNDYSYDVDVSDYTIGTIQTEASSTVSIETTTAKVTTVPVTTVAPTTEAIVGNGVAETVSLSDIPSYSGTPYTVLNNNIPNFSSSELTTKGYEKYSSLDSYGRCGVAIASCGKEIMPADGEERGSISSIKPSGWIQAKYQGISGGYLWNRCHLIGWQLSAENANKKNLITGTRYMNTEGMLPFENMVADYIEETNNHVAYRITPIFSGSDLVCSGVQMEAYSIEDSGEGIFFNVYCYNVQPGISIDYATGNSSGPSIEPETEAAKPVVPEPEDDNDYNSGGGGSVWIPQSGSKYHSRPGCSNMKNPTEVSKDEAVAMGYEPCKRCY